MRFREQGRDRDGRGAGHRRGLRQGARGARARSVVVADVNEAQGARVAERDRDARRHGALRRASTSRRPSRRRRWPTATIDAYGGIDYLVNNAAIYQGMQIAPLIAVDWDYYKRFMDVNMHGALLCVRACYESMGQASGRGDRQPELDRGVDGRSASTASRSSR